MKSILIKDEIAEKLESGELVIVPKTPTKEMLDHAWACALDEDAAGVWREMIGTGSLSLQNGKV